MGILSKRLNSIIMNGQTFYTQPKNKKITQNPKICVTLSPAAKIDKTLFQIDFKF